MAKRCLSSNHQDILGSTGRADLMEVSAVAGPAVDRPFCDDVERAIADKQVLLDWHQQQLSETESAADRALHRRAIRQLRREIAALQPLLNRCVERSLVIAGIERTQATQFFSITGQGSNAGGNNTVPFVQQRPLLLRVYVDDRRPVSVPNPVITQSVTGRVRYRHVDSPQWVVLGPVNGSIVPRPLAAIDRGKIDDTLNFRIPAKDCRGTVQVIVDIFDLTLAAETGFEGSPNTSSTIPHATTPLDSATFHVRFEAVPAFAVRAVLIHYKGGGLDVAAPAGLQFAVDFLLTLGSFPIGRLVIGDCVVQEFGGDLSGGQNGPGWYQLLDLLRDLNAGSAEICVGLLPNLSREAAGRVEGIAEFGVGAAAALATRPATLAHEIGHVLERHHAPNPACDVSGGFGCPLDVDPDYPRYGNFVTGSIGEFGVNCSDFTVFDPRSTLDLMAYPYIYFRPGWVSPYTYVGLWNGMTARFGAAQAAAPKQSESHETWLYLRFSIESDGSVKPQPSFLRNTSPRLTGGFGAPQIWCELVNSAGEVTHTHRCSVRDPYQDVDVPPLYLYEAIPWSPATHEIRFRRGSEVVGKIDVEDAEPSVTLVAPAITERSVTLEWRANDPQGRKLTYLVEYSNDDGRVWRGVARCDDCTSREFPIDSLAGGERCRFRVLASSGIRTGRAESDAFPVPQAPRRAYILSPATDEQLVAGKTVTLRGAGFAPGLGLTDQKDVVWTSSLDGTLGYGYEVVCRLSPGLHAITVIVPDGVGGRSSTTVTVHVIFEEA